MLNLVPPWRSGFKPTQAPSSAELFQCRNASASHKSTALTIRASNSMSIGNDLAQLLHVLLCCLRCLPLLLLCHLGSCGAFVVVLDASACQTGLWYFPQESCRVLYQRLYFGRGLSKTIAINMSPPSSWMSAGRLFCSWSRIATALFSPFPFFHRS